MVHKTLIPCHGSRTGADWRLLHFLHGEFPSGNQKDKRVAVCGIASLATVVEERLGRGRRRRTRMTVPCGLAASIVDMVWAVLAEWVSTCLVIANEIARAMRSGEIGPFIVG